MTSSSSLSNATGCILGALIGLSLSGCVEPTNERLTLGGSYISPTLDLRDQEPLRLPEPSDSVDLLLGQVPPRTGWSGTSYIAPFDATVHRQPLIISARLSNTLPPRAYGRFPTRMDVLDTQSSGWMDQFMMCLGDYGRSCVGSPYAMFMLVHDGRLNEPDVSPSPYKRRPRVEWASGTPIVDQEQNPSQESPR